MDPSSVPAAVAAIQAFTLDLFDRTANGDNAVSSPYSVAVGLAMTTNGARGDTAEEMLDVMRIPDVAQLNTGLNSVTQLIATRSGPQLRRDGSETEIALAVVNSLWGQRDTTWERVFLDAVAGHYGGGMRLVDYVREREAARTQINQWIADSTRDRITDLVSADMLTALTRLVLVNAIYLKAPWAQPFEKSATEPRPFTRADGSVVEVDMMAAALDRGEVNAGSGLGGLLGDFSPVDGLQVQMPRWEFRVQRRLDDDLVAMGMPTAFDASRSDMSAMTTDERLFIAVVIHEAFIAVDEDGTEAAAVTAVVNEASAPPPSDILVLDRPFFFVLHDVETGTPLFIGTVADPTAT